MRSWCRRHPFCFMAGYMIFYLVFFFFLENAVATPAVWIHCKLDDWIPFCKYFIVPYFLWFFWVAGTLLYLLWRAPRAEFWRLCLPLFIGMTLSLLFCALVPNGVALRPHSIPGNDIFAQAVRLLWRTDTSTNVCPSIHVFNSVTVAMAYHRSTCFDDQRYRWVRVSAHLLNLSIILSTMFLKQHSVIDVFFGILLAFSLDFAATLYTEKERLRRPHRLFAHL